jgi:hypothetical protein
MKLQDELLGAIDDLKGRLDWLERAIKSKQHGPYAAASVQSSLKRLQHWLTEYDRATD